MPELTNGLLEGFNSGIGRVFLSVTLVSIAGIALLTGCLGLGLALGGWVGLFAAVIANELTDGHLMDDSWIAP